MDADDFALADSFINFDYSPTSDHPPDLFEFGSGSEDPDPPVVFSGVEERFEIFSLVENENEVNGNSVIRGEIIANDDYENNEIRGEIIANDYVINEMESEGGGDVIANDDDDAQEMATESGVITSEITANDDESGEIRGEVIANDDYENSQIRGEIIANDYAVNEMESEGGGDVIANDDAKEIATESGVITSEITANDDESGEIRGEVIANDEANEMESESIESESESSSSGSESKEEYELEEGEIVGSDCDDSKDDSEEMTSWGVDVDNDDDRCQRCRSRSELELKTRAWGNLPRVPPVNVSLGPHHKMLPVGVVTSIVGAQVIVQGVEKHDPLNEGSILWITERQTPLGLIDEIFGQVKNPYYAVRYNSENEVPEGIREGTLISFVAECVNHVLNHKDLYKKGYDASGMNDEEVSDEAEFSDDEKEAEYNRLQKQIKRGQNNQNPARMKNAKQQVPLKDGFIPINPVAPAVPLVAHGHCPPIPSTGQGFFGVAHGHTSPLPCTGQSFFGATNVNPPFPHANGGPMCTTGVCPNGGTLPPQQSAMCPENTQISQQLPMQGIPFQQQFNPSQRFPPPTIYPGGQPNMYADPMHAQGPVNQNQWSPFPQFQAPTDFNPNHIPGNQGVPSQQFNPPANFHSNHISGNQGVPSQQFNPPANFHSNHISGNQGVPSQQFNPPANFHSNHIPGNQGVPSQQFNPPANFHSNHISGNQGVPSQQFNPPANFHSNHISGNQGVPSQQFNPPANFHSNHISGNQGVPSQQFNPPANFHSNHISDNQGVSSQQFNPPANFHSNHISGNQGGPPHQSNPPGGPPHQFNPPGNFHPGSISGNQHPQQFHQFNPGAYDGRGRAFSAGRGRRPFRRGGRGWRPAR